MKHSVAAAFFIAGLMFVCCASGAGTPDSRLLGRPGAGVVDHTVPKPNAALQSGDPLAVSEGFDQFNVADGGVFANGWTRQNNSDEPSGSWWNCIPTSQFGAFNAFDGADDSCALDSYGVTQLNGGTISDWLVTPPVTFGAGSTVSFHTRTKVGSTYPDRLQVRACTSGPCTNFGTGPEDVGDFTTLIYDINPGEQQSVYPETWTQYTLGTYDGVPSSGTGRIAFRYYVHDSGPGGSRGNLIGLDRVVVTTGQGASGPLDLAVSVAPADPAHPKACGAATSIDVTVGDQVNLCYTVTNNSADTLLMYSLRDNVYGNVLTQQPATVMPGTTYQYNRVLTVGESASLSSTWTAFPTVATIPWYLQPQPRTHAYNWDNSQSAPFIDISNGTPIPMNSTPPTIAFPSDFNFLLYGRPIANFCASYAGIFQALEGPGCSSADPGPSLLIYSSRFGGGGSGNLYYKTIGTAPNRQFVVEWSGVLPAFGPTQGLTAEIVLNETVNTIEYRYGNVVFGMPGLPNYDYGGDATIGLQNQLLTDIYSHGTQSLENTNRLIWTPVASTGYTNTSQIQINAGTPAIVVNPTAAAATAPSHGTATQTLSIGNSGNGRLDWAIQTASFPANMPIVPHFVVPLGDPAEVSFARPPHVEARTPMSPVQPVTVTPAASTTSYAYAVDLSEGPYLRNFDPQDIANTASIVGYLDGSSLFTGATFLDDDFTRLYAFDAANSQLDWFDVTQQYASTHIIGTAAIPADLVTGMKQDPTSGVVYVSTADGHSSGLWTIDPVTAVVRQIGSSTSSPGIIDIAFDAQGNLYGVDLVLDALVAIDKTSGAAQPIGSLGFRANYASGLAMDYATGTLYFSSTDVGGGGPGLWTIDTTTGAATLVSPIPPINYGATAVWDALAITHPANNPCSDPATLPWLRLGTVGGQIPAGGDPASVTAYFDATSLVDGTYAANLCIHSNDPLHLRQMLPVSFKVGVTADTIFNDGFDGVQP